MKHKPDLKLLKRFLRDDPIRKAELAVHFHLSSTSAIEKWISRGKLPRIRRAQILKYIREEIDGKLSRAS